MVTSKAAEGSVKTVYKRLTSGTVFARSPAKTM